jgi:hypothetical protein
MQVKHSNRFLWVFLQLIPLLLPTKSLLRTSQEPVILNLKRIIPGVSFTNGTNLSNHYRPSRTKPAFFQEMLGLTPNQDFNLNVENWKILQQSSLFSDLTASTVVKEDGVALEITGYENPSLKFAPQSSIGGSIDNPEVSFAVS